MRGSVLTLRTICSPSRSSSVHSPHWPHFIVEAALLASTARLYATPSATGLKPQSPPGPQPHSFLCYFSASALLIRLSSCLRGSFQRQQGWVYFLRSRACPGTQAGRHTRTPRRPSARSRASSAPAGRPERCFPRAAHKGNLPGLQPAGFRSSSPTPPHLTPRPHEILGLIPRG